MFRAVGFRSARALIGGRGLYLSVPAALVAAVEAFLGMLPRQFGRTMARRLPLRVILGAKLVAKK